MRLSDITNYVVPEPIQLPVKGKVYVIPPASAELGLWCQATYAAATAADDDEREAAEAKIPDRKDGRLLPEVLLGDAYQEMIRDGVENDLIKVCTGTVYMYIVSGEESAQTYWEAGGDPEKARRPGNRAQRRAEAKAGATSTDAASETPSPGSSSGTRSRTRSGRGRRAR